MLAPGQWRGRARWDCGRRRKAGGDARTDPAVVLVGGDAADVVDLVLDSPVAAHAEHDELSSRLDSLYSNLHVGRHCTPALEMLDTSCVT